MALAPLAAGREGLPRPDPGLAGVPHCAIGPDQIAEGGAFGALVSDLAGDLHRLPRVAQSSQSLRRSKKPRMTTGNFHPRVVVAGPEHSRSSPTATS